MNLPSKRRELKLKHWMVSSAWSQDLYSVNWFTRAVSIYFVEKWVLRIRAAFPWKENNTGTWSPPWRWQDQMEYWESWKHNERENIRKGVKTVNRKRGRHQNSTSPISQLHIILIGYFHSRDGVNIYCTLSRTILVCSFCPVDYKLRGHPL